MPAPSSCSVGAVFLSRPAGMLAHRAAEDGRKSRCSAGVIHRVEERPWPKRATMDRRRGRRPAQPNLGVIAQYVKDLSFENPGAPETLGPASAAAQHQHFDRRPAARSATNEVEVELKIEARAMDGETVPLRRRTRLCRAVPADQHPGRRSPADHADRVPARCCSRSPARSSPKPPATAASRRCSSIRSISSRSTASGWPSAAGGPARARRLA